MVYVLFLLGFLFLIKGADYFVDGCSNIAYSLKIPPLIIGLTVVAFGTSAPEAAVSITGSIQGHDSISLGNVVGSNIFNLMMVIGMSAFVKPLFVRKSILIKEFPFLILASVLLLALSNDLLFQEVPTTVLSRGDGVIFLMFFGIFIYYLLEVCLSSKNEFIKDDLPEDIHMDSKDCVACISIQPLYKSIIISILGIIGIIIGGKIVVDSAYTIALNFGVSQKLVGLTIVSIGTSLPEFVTSVIAASRGESDIALGNVIGSNIFNLLFILGISAFLSPMDVDIYLFSDIFIMIVVTILTYVFAIRKKDVSKFEGTFLIIAYILYIISVIYRS